jgi:predicted TIM-barrel fold metal-dependent hydrolase
VYGGLTSVFTPHYVRFWYLPPERFEELLLQVGAEYLIFGLDFPYNLEDNTRMGLNTIKQMIPLESERELVLGGNLRRELGIPRPAE